MTAVRNDYALVAAAIGPYHEFSPDFGTGHPSGVNLQLAMDMGKYVNSFRWRDDTPPLTYPSISHILVSDVCEDCRQRPLVAPGSDVRWGFRMDLQTRIVSRSLQEALAGAPAIRREHAGRPCRGARTAGRRGCRRSSRGDGDVASRTSSQNRPSPRWPWPATAAPIRSSRGSPGAGPMTGRPAVMNALISGALDDYVHRWADEIRKLAIVGLHPVRAPSSTATGIRGRRAAAPPRPPT